MSLKTFPQATIANTIEAGKFRNPHCAPQLELRVMRMKRQYASLKPRSSVVEEEQDEAEMKEVVDALQWPDAKPDNCRRYNPESTSGSYVL